MHLKLLTQISIIIAFSHLALASSEQGLSEPFDIISFGTEYWNRLKKGLAFDIYDDGELFLETTAKAKENPDVKLNVVRKFGTIF